VPSTVVLTMAPPQWRHRNGEVVGDKVVARFGDDPQGRQFALCALAFKRDTDDLRERGVG